MRALLIFLFMTNICLAKVGRRELVRQMKESLGTTRIRYQSSEFAEFIRKSDQNLNLLVESSLEKEFDLPEKLYVNDDLYWRGLANHLEKLDDSELSENLENIKSKLAASSNSSMEVTSFLKKISERLDKTKDKEVEKKIAYFFSGLPGERRKDVIQFEKIIDHALPEYSKPDGKCTDWEAKGIEKQDVHDQGVTQICFAHTAVQMYNSELEKVPNRGFSEDAAAWEAAVGSWFGSKKQRTREDPGLFVDGGWACDAYNYLMRKGVCEKLTEKKGYKDFKKQTLKLLEEDWDMAQVEKLLENMTSSSETEETLKRAMAICQKLETELLPDGFQVDIVLILKLIMEDSRKEREVALKDMWKGFCDDSKRLKAPVNKKCNDVEFEIGPGSLDSLHAYMDTGKDRAVGIGYCSILLKQGRKFVYSGHDMGADAKKCGAHASVITGRRFNKKLNKCQFFIRNSWGKKCKFSNYTSSVSGKYREGVECHQEKGGAWVDQDVMASGTTSLQFISEK